jgi:hypothetical protein
MGFPKQVSDANERSNSLIEQFKGQTAPAPQNTPGTPPADPPANEPGPTPPPAAAAPEPAPPKDWKASYLVLRGKYDAEVPRLHAEKAALSAENAGLKEQAKQLQTRIDELQTQAAQGASPANTAAAGLLQEDLDRFDPELITKMQAIALAAAKQEVDPFRSDVAATKAERAERERQRGEDQARSAFMAALTDLVPGWQDLDELPTFHGYLAAADPDTGKQRQEVLQEAVKRYDVASVARIFIGYQRTTQTPPATPAPRPGTSGLAAQQVPEPGGNGRIPQEKPSFTRAEVQKFYQDCATGVIKNPDRIRTIGQQIDEAVREGRIR